MMLGKMISRNKMTKIITTIFLVALTLTIFALVSNKVITQENTNPYTVVEAFPNLTFSQPVGLYHANDGTNRLFVLEQAGKIYVFENNNETSTKTLFLDITDRVLSGGELGLLGMAFHPNFSQNGLFYLDYTASNPRRTIIAEYTIDSTDPNKADKNSERIILEVEQPYSNHNGGQIAFGPDNYLYIALGDGGSGGDPQGNGQNLKTLLGSILRIDVDHQEDGKNYSIPDDNPFKGNTNGYREEIYAYGLRNPWRFSFDNETGWLWAADVGQNKWEEIDIIEKGKNYGWNIMEGNHCYQPSSNCDQTGLELPIWEYGHDANGGYSITGGFVYRGSELPELNGWYIYGDYVVGKIWALCYNGIDPPTNVKLADTSLYISSFGVDENNELYIVSHGNGKIYKLAPNEGVSNPLSSSCSANVTKTSTAAKDASSQTSSPALTEKPNATASVGFEYIATIITFSMTALIIKKWNQRRKEMLK